MGNPEGDVTIVEYFDYLCHYCKDEEAGLEQLLQEDGNLKIIYKDFPKHGPLSVTVAIAALASVRQGADKYQMFHNALLNNNVSITSEDVIYQVAGSVGLDVNRLKQDMADKSFANQVQDNITVGRSIGVQITPTFIIGGYFFPGDSGYDKLKQMVAYVRSKRNGQWVLGSNPQGIEFFQEEGLIKAADVQVGTSVRALRHRDFQRFHRIDIDP